MKTCLPTSVIPVACAIGLTLMPAINIASAQADAEATPTVEAVEVDSEDVVDAPALPDPPQPLDPVGLGGLSDPPPVSELFPDANAEPEPDISESVVINILRGLVQKGVFTEAEVYVMIQQAQKEALAARELAAARRAEDKEAEDEAMRVSYVPEVVRNQMREEIRNQVMADLRGSERGAGNYRRWQESVSRRGRRATLATSDAAIFPAKSGWDIFGDMRFRYELASFPEGNDNTGSFPNFQSINSGAPFDTAGVVFSPQQNVDQERQRYRMRVRVGAEIPMDDHLSAGLRIATGSDNSPVTTNQTFGGGFSKYAIWLDRAFVRYYRDWDNGSATLLGGRFENPFYSTSIIYDEDLGFDGLAAKFKGKIGQRVRPFLTAGAFPIYNTDFNFSSNQPAKFESNDKFLYGAQIGADFDLSDDLTGKLAVAYYNFADVEGRLSTPYLPLSASDAGDTDNTRPAFAQSGNTYRPLRNIIPDALNNFGTSSQYQYFGLATPFEPLSISGKLDYTGFEPVQLSLYGEYIKNTAFNQDDINAIAVNNRGPLDIDADGNASLGLFDGDDTAWILGLKVGKIAMENKWDWTIGANYRWVGSDAVLDGFNDSDFGGGGTNVKGFGIDASLALSPDATLGIRWLSSDEIAGPPLKSDYLQIDFKFEF
ncbi:MAG: putative porin [Verrucomicrobiales bacterium]